MTEVWADIEGYDGLYQISDHGRVRRTRDGLGGFTAGYMFKPSLDAKGYLRVTLRASDGKSKRYGVHVLVLTAFAGSRPPKHDASHLNGDKTDNRISNLTWETRSANIRRKLEHGTLVHGEKHKCSKLKEHEVLDIRLRAAAGERKAHLAREYEVSATLVGYITSNRAWPHLAQI